MIKFKKKLIDKIFEIANNCDSYPCERKDKMMEYLDAFLNEKSNQRTKVCAICGEGLSEIERYSVSADDFNYTCHAHREHRNKYNIERIRKNMGYETKDNQ